MENPVIVSSQFGNIRDKVSSKKIRSKVSSGL
jgi:hypothetical protein